MPFLDQIEAAIPGLRAYARALTRDREVADDLVQDTLEAALARQAQWRGDGPLRAWLARILMNRFRDGLRRKRPETIVLTLVPDPADLSATRAAEGRLALAEVHAAMGRLPEDQRAALLLVALEGMSLAEAASVLGCAEGTLASRLARGRAALRQMTGREAVPHRPGKAGE
ncbi:sigma-70 family RNA polymerase sigma factor [Tabrizicola sp.]|jgi:RNA polymerase sigma-70 factor (ECF subfamily)|uniref:sigma-70 family RNA polymerase sigma factor n=1 Tax=Tabrizicola sp. TaxID=2005166 RepID=UPI001A608D90|nr:sigma-70 family RNA polymerase sigma factor [Tabrizicola sp.]MBL9064271.1 sigma-70 family RNA polymerase sigma factor [Tabrizicola sp.]